MVVRTGTLERMESTPGETPTGDATRRGEVTRLLRAPARGDERDANRLLDLVYTELRELADGYLARERADHTLQPTALVHEAYLRLLGEGAEFTWNDRRHFLATAARAMRHLLVDHARTKRREKRGGRWNRVDLTHAVGEAREEEAVDLVALDEVLSELAELSERQARVVEMRFFAGMGEKSIAEVLEVSERTVERDWRHARAWLAKRLSS